MSQNAASAKWKSLAFLLPGAAVCLFVYFRSDGSVSHRVVSAAVGGFVVSMLGFFGTLFADLFAARLLGEKLNDSQLSSGVSIPPARTFLAGMLLVTAAWMWWQSNRDTTIARVAECVGDVIAEEQLTPEQAVHRCYRSVSGDSRYEAVEW